MSNLLKFNKTPLPNELQKLQNTPTRLAAKTDGCRWRHLLHQ